MIITRQNLSFVYFIMILSILLISSCKKSITDQEEDPIRIKSVYHYWAGQSLNKVVDSNIYVDNHLSVTYTYADYGSFHSDPSSKTTYNYDGNLVISRLYYLSKEDSILSNMRTYAIENGQITSMLYEPVSNADYESKQKIVYEYNGNYLFRETHSICYPNDIWEIRDKNEYFFRNKILDSIIEYVSTGTDIWQKKGKLEFEYSGSKISRLVHFSYSSNIYIQDRDTPYNYSGENILSIGSENSIVTFQYDLRGNLISCDDGNYLMPTKTFQYEAGTGNYALLKYMTDPLSKFEQYPGTICIP